MVHRDIELARLTGARIHLLHLSTAAQRRARAGGQGRRAARSRPRPRRTTSASPTSCCAATTRCSRSTRRCAPPADVAAIKAGLADGTIDAIATDHAPHPAEDKEQPLDDAPPGMLGLETALGVALAELDMPLADVVAALSWKPAAIAGVADRHGAADRRRASRPTSPCSIPTRRGRSRPAALASRSRNTPYVGTRRCAAGSATRCSAATPVVVDGVAQR